MPGHAAEVGIFSTDLTALGWTGAEQILEAERGFFRAEGGGYDPNSIYQKLGRPWTFSAPGVSIKPYPCGSLTHPGMTELQRLIRTENIRPADVDFVEVRTNHNIPNALIHHRPTNNLQAKFSMEFCLAILLLDGKAGLSQFDDAMVNRPDVKAMIERIRFGTDPEAEKAGFDKMTTILKIHLKDGRVISGRADFGKGSPSNPMSYEEVAEKFQDCAAYAKWTADRTRKIVEMVRNLEDVRDMRALTQLCAG